MDTLGKRLTYARKNKEYTQEGLAAIIGVSRGVIYNLEKNKTEPQLIVLNAICAILKINKEWLLYGTGDMMEGTEAKNAKILAEIYNSAQELSVDEQRYILNMINIYKEAFPKK